VRASDAAVQTLVSQLSSGIVGTTVQRMPAADRSSTPLLFDQTCARRSCINGTSAFSGKFATWWSMVAYVGNKGTHLFRMLNANQAVNYPRVSVQLPRCAERCPHGTCGRTFEHLRRDGGFATSVHHLRI
jgi:hypothetical protein